MNERGNVGLALTYARKQSDALFELITPDALYERPIPERHRLVFYVGHLEAFDWNQICRWTLGYDSFHPTFDRLFEAGIDPKVGEASDDRPSDWPSLEEVRTYNARVRTELDRILDRAPETMLHVALEHRLMHVETTAYLLHQLVHEKKRQPEWYAPVLQGPRPAHRMIEIPEGSATLGRDPDEGFGWDNEFRRHAVQVPAFAISRYKVTNGQYLKFVEDGAAPPPFWRRRGKEWYLRAMFADIPLPLDWPVYVTHDEAEAYARWAGKTLPTEAQFHRAAYGTPNGEERPYPWGDDPPSPRYGNFDCHAWDPVPVTATPRGDSAFGVSQMVGNGWEWTSTIFHPFEGFAPLPTYPGYSSRFFDHEHYVMKGGGPQTAAVLLRRSFRNWFRGNYPYMHAGFRCVEM
ncbi:MAG: ergothioneine biosynthesis protein EgtB [Nitrospirae bacterium]|nr:MAG: ergothioneine biosynthesis protein EgtB [Nitrospirota bacterium]